MCLPIFESQECQCRSFLDHKKWYINLEIILSDGLDSIYESVKNTAQEIMDLEVISADGKKTVFVFGVHRVSFRNNLTKLNYVCGMQKVQCGPNQWTTASSMYYRKVLRLQQPRGYNLLNHHLIGEARGNPSTHHQQK